MTEAEWLSSRDPHRLLAFVAKNASERKMRLFAVACCRRIEHLLPSHLDYQRIFEAVEQPPDIPTRTSPNQVVAVAAAHTAAYAAAAVGSVTTDAGTYARHALFAMRPFPNRGHAEEIDAPSWRGATAEHFDSSEQVAQAILLRDVFGNPFRTVSFEAAWLSGNNTSQIAQAIYAERAFDRLPILADALEEAGCPHADVLAHCRKPGMHIRGCWVIDQLLGRS